MLRPMRNVFWSSSIVRISGIRPVIGEIRTAHVVKFVGTASGITAPIWRVNCWLLFLGILPAIARTTEVR